MIATKKLSLEKLPNILILNLKRFIYKKGLIKMKEHVYFEDVLTIDASLLSNHAQIGMFGSKKPKYRLFSVVEHIGPKATHGHYVNYCLDAQNDWVKFDDSKYAVKDYGDIQETA